LAPKKTKKRQFWEKISIFFWILFAETIVLLIFAQQSTIHFIHITNFIKKLTL